MSGLHISRRKFLKWSAAVSAGMVLTGKATPAKTAAAAQRLVIPNPARVNPRLVSTPSDVIPPTVTAISPSSALNDLDTPIVITGTDFTNILPETLELASPTAFLGSTALTQVAWVDSTTLTATVPWGLDPGLYTLTVVNPDGGAGSLAGAFTVTPGIGRWNGGNLFGGEVRQVLMKPGDPATLYAPAYGIFGLFRSDDAAEHWSYVSAAVAIFNGKFAIDPLHPDWLYGFNYQGLHRSQDKGDTWTTLMPNVWPDGSSMNSPQVYVSPHDPLVLLVSSSTLWGSPDSQEAFGLIKSGDGGLTWNIVAGLEGLPVQDVAFAPADALQMVLATSDARVFQSSDAGDTWTEVLKPPLSSLGVRGLITYNPFRPAEVWVAAMSPAGIYKSADAAFSSWQDVSPADGMGAFDIKFNGADSVYITRHHSTDGGLTWSWFGPIQGYGELCFDPDHPGTAYLGDNTCGVQKTTDGGQTWEVKSQGLAGMRCASMIVSSADPLRVYAVFGTMPGIHRSADGVNTWDFFTIPDTVGSHFVCEDPFDPQRIYVAADSFAVSTDGGKTWSNLGWNLPAASPPGMCWAIKPDPFQAGHLLLGMVSTSNFFVAGSGWLYSSSDYGASWQDVTPPPGLAWISDIVFDPETPGLVYVATGGTGIYRSVDSGASWTRIDDLLLPNLQYVDRLAIATYPAHVLFVSAKNEPYRSWDGGVTWEKAQNSPGGSTHPTFVNGDSTRLYVATNFGLYFSSDVGDSWEQAAGSLGRLQILALCTAAVNDSTVLYAATSGGDIGATGSKVVKSPLKMLAKGSNLMEAGIYRYVQHTWMDFLPAVMH